MTNAVRKPQVPGWEILEPLGTGGMGDVWLARSADGVRAAVKVARAIAALSAEENAALFRREALAAFGLEHPNLVKALDAGVTADGRRFVALEFAPGRTLAAEIRGGGALPEERVVHVGLAVARALEYAHRAGLLHRDVKPGNVMLAPDGAVKLLDLGLVAETVGARDATALGTAGYLAPECVAGGAPSARSDLFALGATLASAALGERARRAGEFVDRTLPAKVGDRPLTAEFRWVVGRLLRRDPRARYGSAAELVLDLEALAAGERPLGAILGAGAARAMRRGRRVAVAAAGAAVVAAVAWLVARPAERPHSTPADAPTVAAPPAAAVAAAPRDPKLEAARVFLREFPDDVARGREVLASVDASVLTEEERSELRALGATIEARADAAAAALWRDADARATDAAGRGDLLAAHELLAAAAKPLRGSRFEPDAARRAESLLARLRAETDEALAEAATALGAFGSAEQPPIARASLAQERIRELLERRPFEGDRRADLVNAGEALQAALAAALRREEAARAAAERAARFRDAIAAHLARPTPERLREVLDAAVTSDAPQDVADAARRLALASTRAEAAIADALSRLVGTTWCGPVRDALFVGRMDAAPAADDVYLSPLWSASGGRVDAIARAAGGRDEAAAWLLARGRLHDARVASSAGAALATLLGADGDPTPTPAPPRLGVGIDVALAARASGDEVAGLVAADGVIAAWASAIRGRRRPALAAGRNPAKETGREAFLADRVAEAADALAQAAAADPWDAEIAVLRSRTLLLAARRLPTTPALLAAFSEARRAWDLDPKMSAGPLLAAETGLELVAAGDEVLTRFRAAVAAACEGAVSVGGDDPRMLVFAATWRLDNGRAADAVPLARRAAARAPDDADVALCLARAEHAAGNVDKARAALRRVRELNHGTLPAAAADLARALGD